MICRKFFYKQLTQFSQGNNVKMLPLKTKVVFFGKIHVFLELS
jgi:hypothetical protein